MIYIGIDPGLSGAIAAVNGDGRLMQVWDTPVAVVKKTRRDYMVANMAAIVAGEAAVSPIRAVLEQGIAMPRQASNTTYLMGRGGGLWEGILAALAISYDLVPPQKWRKGVGIPPKADKGYSRMLAQRMFPDHSGFFARVKDDGRAEAALIAFYCRQSNLGGGSPTPLRECPTCAGRPEEGGHASNCPNRGA